MRTVGQMGTHITKLVVALRNFANGPGNEKSDSKKASSNTPLLGRSKRRRKRRRRRRR